MKEIELTQGKVALVHDMDYKWLNYNKWYAFLNGRNWYAGRRGGCVGGKRHNILMHREIMGLEHGDGFEIDHINRDGLDNRRENLRIVSRTTNQRNHRLLVTNKSGYNGVHLDNNTNKWRAQIWFDGSSIKLGSFSDIQGAVVARKQAEMEYWGEV